MKRRTPFFVVGTPRSGTTLLQVMLNRGPTLYIPPETHFLPYYSHWTGKTRSSRDQFRILDLVKQKICDRNELPVDWPQLKRELRAAPGTMLRQFDALLAHLIAQNHSNRRLGEKTPGHLHYVDDILDLYPTAQIVRLVRDGRDVVVSHNEAFGSNMLHMAFRWRQDQRRSSRLAEVVPAGQYLNVRYEGLVRESEQELRRVCRFLGEPFDQAMLTPEKRRVRGFARRESHKERTWMPVDPSRVGRYRKILRPRTLAMLQTVFGSELAAEGYELDDVPKLPGYATLGVELPKMIWLRRKAKQRRRVRLGEP